MAMMTGGQALVAALEAHGVSIVFGIPGTHNLEIYRHLATSPIEHVVCRHEQGAGYAADGYARAARRPGVIVTTSGPGVLNASAALASAYADSIPVLAIAPGPPLGMDGLDRGWMHEVKDQFGALAAVVDRATRPTSSQEAADAVHSAFRTWAYNRPRPVFIEVPVDVLEGIGEVDLQPAVSELPVAAHDDEQLAKLVTLLQGARAPVMVVGGGAVNSFQLVRHVAELAGIPVIATMRGKGVMPTDHPLAVGPVLATEAARALVGGADLAVFVGTELSDAELDGRPLVCTGMVCRIDISENQLHKNLSADIALHCDAGLALTQLAGALAPVANRDGEERATVVRRAAASELETVTKPHRWIHEALEAVLSPEDIVVGDSSQVTYQGSVHLWPSTVPDGLVAPASFATLGYAVPAAIGCAIARTGRRVVALLGDGALMFSVQELRTAADLGQPLPVLVVDNGGYREIAEEMDDRGILRTAVDLAPADFEALAKAMGCAYADGSNQEALVDSLRAALQRSGPTLIRIPDRAFA